MLVTPNYPSLREEIIKLKTLADSDPNYDIEQAKSYATRSPLQTTFFENLDELLKLDVSSSDSPPDNVSNLYNNLHRTLYQIKYSKEFPTSTAGSKWINRLESSDQNKEWKLLMNYIISIDIGNDNFKRVLDLNPASNLKINPRSKIEIIPILNKIEKPLLTLALTDVPLNEIFKINEDGSYSPKLNKLILLDKILKSSNDDENKRYEEYSVPPGDTNHDVWLDSWLRVLLTKPIQNDDSTEIKLYKTIFQIFNDQLFNEETIHLEGNRREVVENKILNTILNFSEKKKEFALERLENLKEFFNFDDNSKRLIHKFLNELEKYRDEPLHELKFKNKTDGRYSLYPGTEEHLKRVATWISYGGITSDSPPWGENEEGYLKAMNEAVEIALKVEDLHRGFLANAYDAKSLPHTEEFEIKGIRGQSISGVVQDNQSNDLIEFGKNAFDKVYRIHSSNPHKYPGSGLLLEGMKPQIAFGFGDLDLSKDSEERNSYLEYIKGLASDFSNAGLFYIDTVNQASKSTFFFTRGFMGVIPPKEEPFLLKNHQNQDIPYSLLIFNDHFGEKRRGEHDRAFLVPTQIINVILNRSKVIHDSEIDPMDNKRDINLLGEILNSKRLQELSNKLAKADILNLTWSSNIGSLTNAYPPFSEPHFKWEQNLKNTRETQDLFGHYHKTHARGYYERRISKELYENIFVPLQKVHKDVYESSLAMINLMYLYKTALSYWHKGHTNPERIDATKANFETQGTNENEMDNGAIAMEDAPELQNADSQEPGNHNYYMLERAYKLHNQIKAKFKDKPEEIKKSMFPLLTLANTFNWSSPPNTVPFIDLYDMTLYRENDKGTDLQAFPLSMNGIDDKSKELFKETFLTHLNNANTDFRFYPRDSTFSKKGNLQEADYNTYLKLPDYN